MEAKYTCPIHKDVTFDEVNKCPKCLNEEARKKAFEKNPEAFVHLTELVIATKLDERGLVMVLVNQACSAYQLHIAMGEITRAYQKTLDAKAAESAKRIEKMIIPAGPNIDMRSLKKECKI